MDIGNRRMDYYNPIQIIKRVGKAMGVKDVRQDKYHRIVVTFHDNTDVENRKDVKEHMEKGGYTPDKVTKHKIKFKSV